MKEEKEYFRSSTLGMEPEPEEVLATLFALQNEEPENAKAATVAPTESDPDGAAALLERGWELVVSAHGGNIETALRSWKLAARKWREDCHDWAETNPLEG